MCMVFRMEDLVASAFIGLLESGNEDSSHRRISMRQLAEYKYNVVKALNEKKKAVVIPISRGHKERFFYLFFDYFYYEKNNQTDDYIYLDNKKTLMDLKNEFSLYIPDEVRCCFEDKKTLAPILAGK